MYQLLQSVRVLELGQVIAGTYPGMILADLGAEVIKVEPEGGESGRDPKVTGLRGDSSTSLTMNRGKKSIVLDLKSPAGREVFYDLVRRCDVVVDNYRPGVMARLGIAYADLCKVNPRIICCSLTGFGAEDARSQLPSYDLMHQAISGLMSLTGEPDRPPVRLGIPLGDLGCGMFAAIGILAALHRRTETGHGEQLNVAMYDSMVALLTYIGTLYLAGGDVPVRWGTAHEHVVPWQAFSTSDGHLVVAVRAEHFWPPFCSAIARPDLITDPRCLDNKLRVAHRAELVPLLEDVLCTRTTAEWLQRFAAAGVPAAPVNTLAETFADPYIQQRMVVEYDHPKVGSVRLPGNPIKFPTEDEVPVRPAPLVSEHAAALLTDLLGYPPEQVRRLLDSGAVGKGE